MRTAKDAPLSDYIVVPFDDTEMQRQWSRIRERRGVRPGLRPWWRWSLGPLALAAAAAVAVHASMGSTIPEARLMTQTGSQAVIETGAQAVAMRLPDGSRVELGPAGRLEGRDALGSDIRFSVARGRASFDVSHDPDRVFAVEVGSVRVVVIGTRFSVARRDDRVEVRVESGQVDVHTGRAVHRLGAGETWSGRYDHEGLADAAEVLPMPSEAELDAGDQARARRAHRSREREAEARAVSAAREVSANDVFEQARAERRAGDDAAAARRYEELLRRFPEDEHVSLAAFELGRIRMDSLHATAAAVGPLERALSERNYREDAMARLVRAYDELGRESRCRTTRERYLREFPSGVHHDVVEARCASDP
jgi:FecR protein